MIPLQGSQFRLDTSGVAGFFGGEEAVSAMATVPLFKWRRWLGWYNSPGTYVVARKYGQLSNSRFWDALFPGMNTEPTVLFGFDGYDGPEFIAAHSGAQVQNTGHIGRLFLEECRSLEPMKFKMDGEERITTPYTVTIAELNNTPEYNMDVTQSRNGEPSVAYFPILWSTAACIICGLYRDWYSSSMILLGMLSGGLSCLALGSASFTYSHPKPAPGSPKGDGVLFSRTGTDIVVLHGKEEAVNSITRGKFKLRFSGEPEYRTIGLAAILLTTQSLVQLLLIPQGILFGQIMFLSTLAVSWTYNCYLSSLDRDQIQRKILTKTVLGVEKSTWKKYSLGTRTAMVTFLLLHLQPHDPRSLLDKLLPNETKTWDIWKRVMLDKVQKAQNDEKLSFNDSDFDGVANEERVLLQTLYKDVGFAYQIFQETLATNYTGSYSA